MKKRFRPADLPIQYKLIIGIILILIVALMSISLVFIKKSENFLIQGLEKKADLINRNFSIVSAEGIQESTFSGLQTLINRVAANDPEIRLLMVAYPNGLVIATSDSKNYRQFSKIENKMIMSQLEKKEDLIIRNKEEKILESVRLIYSDPETRDEEDEEDKEDAQGTFGIIAKDKKGDPLGFIYLALDMTGLENSIRELWLQSTLIAIVLKLAGIILAYFFGSRMAKPIKKLAREVRVIASGNLDNSIHAETSDEVGQLVSDVEKMRLSIKELTDHLEDQVKERTAQLKKAMDALWGEMELAKKIQTCLLPVSFDNIHPDFEIAATMVTADEVGGDFYEVTLDMSGALWLAIGDVSGHGVTPGLIMMMAQTAHTSVTANINCEARDVIIKTNEVLYMNVHERLKETHFMTFTALKYLGQGRFQHAGAHLSMVVYRQEKGRCELIKTKGIYLNFKKDISKATKNNEFCLESGDILVLYTDGLTEAENQDGKMLDIDGFVRLVEKHAHQEPEAMKDIIMADVINWCNDKRADDMSLVVVKMKEDSCMKEGDVQIFSDADKRG
ncbi:MAG: SpoIIE family protein phosphatase [Desulfobacterales bacterium]|nr:SpoIIE family protein phosphatase [Desulfobacterales bacterium]